MANALIPTRPPVNKEHHRWRSTDDVRETLEGKFPSLTFPYLDSDHTHGVRSAIHVYCQHHDTFTRVSLPGLLYDSTQFACAECAAEHGHALRKAAGFSFRNYVGKRGVQSGIFKAVKAVFPDAVWEHRMKCGKEIDIWVPSLETGVEYNGNYYHSTACKTDNAYHSNKSAQALGEGKLILHVFSDEAVEPYSGIINNLKVRTIPARTRSRYNFANMAEAEALAFHKQYNFLFHETLMFADIHIGAYDSGRLVAVVSGRKVSKKIFYQTTTNLGVPLKPMLEMFDRKVAKIKGGRSHIAVDLRNPTNIMWAKISNLHELAPTGILRYPLKKDFSVDWSLPDDPPEGTHFVYDCGGQLFG